MHRRHFFAHLAATLAAPAVAAPLPEIRQATEDFPPWLAAWRNLPQQPVWSWDDPVVQAVVAAAKQQRVLHLRYQRGSTPGALRRFTPAQGFRVWDACHAPLYLNGWCHERQQHRTLRLDHIVLVGSCVFESATVNPA